MSILKTKAIQTALLGDWNAAVTSNKELLKENPKDIEALNRLAFALFALGKNKDAKAAYQKVLALDILNPIALRGLSRLSGKASKKNSQTEKQQTQNNQKLISNIFLEETGKTKIVELINVAEPKTIAKLRTGESVILSIKRSKMFILGNDKHYLGMLPDNIGRRLIKFLNGGNAYQAHVKSVLDKHIAIFIKETKRSNKFKNQPSFISSEKLLVFSEKITITSSKHKSVDPEDREDGKSYSPEDDLL